MGTGQVKCLNGSNGFGRATPEHEEDGFVHFSAITGEEYESLYEGNEVEFEITQGQKDPQATKVSMVF